MRFMDHPEAPTEDPRVALILGESQESPELAIHTVGWSLFNFIESSGLGAQLYNGMHYSDSLGMSCHKAGGGHLWDVD